LGRLWAKVTDALALANANGWAYEGRGRGRAEKKAGEWKGKGKDKDRAEERDKVGRVSEREWSRKSGAVWGGGGGIRG